MRLLIATRGEEAEPVTVEQRDGVVVFHLDDGEDLVLDAEELAEVLSA